MDRDSRIRFGLAMTMVLIGAMGCSQSGAVKDWYRVADYTSTRLTVNPANPHGQTPWPNYKVLVGIRSPTVKDGGQRETLDVTANKQWINPMFVYVTGREGQVDLVDVSVSAEGTTFAIFLEAKRMFIYHYARDETATPPQKVKVTVKDGIANVSREMTKTSYYTLDYASGKWSFVENDAKPFTEQDVDTDTPKFPDLDQQRSDQLKLMHKLARDNGMPPK